MLNAASSSHTPAFNQDDLKRVFKSSNSIDEAAERLKAEYETQCTQSNYTVQQFAQWIIAQRESDGIGKDTGIRNSVLREMRALKRDQNYQDPVVLDDDNLLAQSLKTYRVERVNWTFAVLSFIMSALAALSISCQWFLPSSRGAFIITLSVSNIILRFIQYHFLGGREPKKVSAEIFPEEAKYLKEKSLVHMLHECAAQNSNQAECDENDQEIVEEMPSEEELNRLSSFELKLFKLGVAERIKELEDERRRERETVADLADSKSVVVHTFMVLGTVAECMFDLVQGILLLLHIEYDSNAGSFIVLGTWLGVADEAIDFILDSMAQFLEKSFSANAVFIYCGVLLSVVVLEQCLSIHAAVTGLLHIGPLLWVPVGAATVILTVTVALFVYLVWKRCTDYKFENGSGLPFLDHPTMSASMNVRIFDLF